MRVSDTPGLAGVVAAENAIKSARRQGTPGSGVHSYGGRPAEGPDESLSARHRATQGQSRFMQSFTQAADRPVPRQS